MKMGHIAAMQRVTGCFSLDAVASPGGQVTVWSESGGHNKSKKSICFVILKGTERDLYVNCSMFSGHVDFEPFEMRRSLNTQQTGEKGA
jgi:hypothetical protein